VVSEVSITIDGITTTTITYSDGTSEVETSAANTQSSQGHQAGQTYNAQGALSGNAQSTSSASAGV
jgi:hypothetical protein